MRVTVNGKGREVREGTTLRTLLTELKITAEAVVVMRNAGVVPPEDYDPTELRDGDVIELVRIVGGG